jgi:hypothetical protein
MHQNLIYGLIDPRNGQLRYVGKSMSGLTRPKGHATPSGLKKSSGTHKGNWIRQLMDGGLKPEIVVLECSDVATLCEAESFWISYARFIGCDLTNATDGGVGRLGHSHIPSENARARISAVQKTMWSDLHHRQRMSSAHGGRPFRDGQGRIYRTLTEAVEALGVDKSNICACLNNRRKTTGGFAFTYDLEVANG